MSMKKKKENSLSNSQKLLLGGGLAVLATLGRFSSLKRIEQAEKNEAI